MEPNRTAGFATKPMQRNESVIKTRQNTQSTRMRSSMLEQPVVTTSSVGNLKHCYYKLPRQRSDEGQPEEDEEGESLSRHLEERSGDHQAIMCSEQAVKDRQTYILSEKRMTFGMSALNFSSATCRITERTRHSMRRPGLSRRLKLYKSRNFVTSLAHRSSEMVSRPTDDTVLCPHPALDDGPTLKDIIIDSGCKVLAELSDATESSGDVRFSSCFAGTKLTQKMKETQRTTYGFDRRRTIMFTGGTEAFQNGFWLRKTKKVMKELNAEVPCIPSTAKGSFRFLDLGCCPGGFSAYILEKNKLSRSLGISLPTEAGGYAYCLESRQRRETFLPADLTLFDLRPLDSSDVECAPGTLKPVPREITNRVFDLTILGATPLSWVTRADSQRLLVSQLILGLQGVKNGGTIIAVLQDPESPVTARVLYLLDKISRKITIHKSSVVHQARSSFYVIAQGVGEGEGKDRELRDGYLKSFRTLWVELTFDGVREMVNADLDFIVTVDELSRTSIDWLVALCGKVWEIQLRALESGCPGGSKDSSFSSVRDMSFSSSVTSPDTSFTSL
ncbi:hypothetical protein CPB85DRAFT_1530152 [Mucidula mucida]|nr:hypothetical protein CPB85DRAFT_1530152 [Mucidula mucida]